VIDDPGAGGIPEGLLELGNAILRKLDPGKHAATRKFLVSKWLFTVFLCNVVIHPEVFLFVVLISLANLLSVSA
jgi:hypothetical protein